MTERLEINELGECYGYLTGLDPKVPKCLEALEIGDIRKKLQRAAEVIVKSDRAGDQNGQLQLLEHFLKKINNEFPLNEHTKRPPKCDERFGKPAPEVWQQALDHRRQNR